MALVPLYGSPRAPVIGGGNSGGNDSKLNSQAANGGIGAGNNLPNRANSVNGTMDLEPYKKSNTAAVDESGANDLSVAMCVTRLKRNIELQSNKLSGLMKSEADSKAAMHALLETKEALQNRAQDAESKATDLASHRARDIEKMEMERRELIAILQKEKEEADLLRRNVQTSAQAQAQQLEQLKFQIYNSADMHTSHEQEVQLLRDQVVTQTDMTNQLIGKMNVMKKASADFDSNYDSLRTEFEEFHTTHVRLSALLDKQKKLIAQQEQRIQLMTAALATANAKYDAAESRCREQTAVAVQASEKLQLLQSNVDALTNDLNRARNEHRTVVGLLADTQTIVGGGGGSEAEAGAAHSRRANNKLY